MNRIEDNVYISFYYHNKDGNSVNERHFLITSGGKYDEVNDIDEQYPRDLLNKYKNSLEPETTMLVTTAGITILNSHEYVLFTEVVSDIVDIFRSNFNIAEYLDSPDINIIYNNAYNSIVQKLCEIIISKGNYNVNQSYHSRRSITRSNLIFCSYNRR